MTDPPLLPSVAPDPWCSAVGSNFQKHIIPVDAYYSFFQSNKLTDLFDLLQAPAGFITEDNSFEYKKIISVSKDLIFLISKACYRQRFHHNHIFVCMDVADRDSMSVHTITIHINMKRCVFKESTFHFTVDGGLFQHHLHLLFISPSAWHLFMWSLTENLCKAFHVMRKKKHKLNQLSKYN